MYTRLCLIIPFYLRNAILGEVEGTMEAYHATVYGMLTFVNISFISGMCYLVLAIYKAIRMPLMGYVFAKVIRKIQKKDKVEFYIKSVIAAIWMGFVIWKYPSVDEFFTYMNLQYRIPGLAKVIGSCCSILLCFAIAYGTAPIIEKWKFGYRKLTEYSENISKLYAVHIGIFLIIAALLSFVGVGTEACFGWSVIVFVLTDLTVKGYIAVEKRIVRKGD